MRWIVVFFSVFLSLFLVQQVFAQSQSNPIDIIIGEPDFSGPEGGEIPSTRPSDYRQALINEFGITMNGFTQNQYMWAWELMHRTSNTRFPGYVAGTTITARESTSQQDGCKSVFLRSTSNGFAQDRDLFEVVFTHEMGHIVYHCGVDVYLQDEYFEALYAEGPISPYGRTLCYYDNYSDYALKTENYAEMVAYYLNPTSRTRTGCGNEPNPFLNGGSRFPLHYENAVKTFTK